MFCAALKLGSNKKAECTVQSNISLNMSKGWFLHLIWLTCDVGASETNIFKLVNLPKARGEKVGNLVVWPPSPVGTASPGCWWCLQSMRHQRSAKICLNMFLEIVNTRSCGASAGVGGSAPWSPCAHAVSSCCIPSWIFDWIYNYWENQPTCCN